jgi:UDP:flavonoid glycosyltransferase YjiC (YdhE family)
MLQPFGRTRAFPSALLPARLSFGDLYNRASYYVMEQAMWLPWRRMTNEWRRQTLGLSSHPGQGPWKMMYTSGFPCLYGFSPAILPAPEDWPPAHVITGYWFLDEEPGWTPGNALEKFLSSGSRPLYIGFGSMGANHDRRVLRVVEAALELSGLRAVVTPGGHSGGPFPESSRRMIFEEQVPHAWLFPRVSAVMHHGGAGTTAEGLRAGVPSIIFPGASDQYFWAERIARLGAGPRPVGRGDLTPAGLAKLFIRAVMDPGMRDRARLLGARIRAENGVARAMETLLRLISGPRL